LQNVMVPSVRMLYPNGIIHLQQDHSSIHDSRAVQESLSRQADIEIIDWPPWVPDMNPIENMWSEVKRTMQETWHVLQRWAMGPCVRHVGWSFFVSALHSITKWVHDMTNEICGRSRRILDFLLKRSISENSPFKG
jgi:hypothetical protein